jgi:hypothetical protein
MSQRPVQREVIVSAPTALRGSTPYRLFASCSVLHLPVQEFQQTFLNPHSKHHAIIVVQRRDYISALFLPIKEFKHRNGALRSGRD